MIGRSSASAEPENLFKVNKYCEKLQRNKTVQFHSLAEKTLYATKQSRPNTCTAVQFLTTIVRALDLDDWAKMAHMMKYIRSTRTLPLIISSNGSGILKWWVDSLCAVHPNMRGNSSRGLSLGRVFPIVGSTKQNLNTRSSTETELVGDDDLMPAICWNWYFMKSQGYRVLKNVLFQDNRSYILLEKNGKALSSKRTKHIKNRYLFITDRVKHGDV